MGKIARCPSCGAPVEFKSVVSVLAVCDFCQSTLVRRGEELENLATEKDADAARLREVGRRAAERAGQPRHHDDYRSGDTELLAKRAEVSERLATRLRELGSDAEFCGELVDRARHEAWEEIAVSITARARQSSRGPDPDYDRERGGRMLALLGDLADLENRER